MSKTQMFDCENPIQESGQDTIKIEPSDETDDKNDDNIDDIPEIEFNGYCNTEQEITTHPFIGLTSRDLRRISPSMTMRDFVQSRKRPRQLSSGFIDYTQTRYYDRYKQQEYTRRNDYMKYCHVCRKKTVGKLRVLPGDLRMRKVWILRSNLDEERSAELWLREMACEGSHGGEFCEVHFPPDTIHLKGTELFPLDVRPPEARHSIKDDIKFDFEDILLQCVFCGREGNLGCMLPFIRNRAKRAKWIERLSAGNFELRSRLQQTLRGGVTQFLCDWHIADSSFEINGFGEWRLLRNALPDPTLTASDKIGHRVYLVDKCRDRSFWDDEMYKELDHCTEDNDGNGENDDNGSHRNDDLVELEHTAEEIQRFLDTNGMSHAGDSRMQLSNNKQMLLPKSRILDIPTTISDLINESIVEKEVIVEEGETATSSSDLTSLNDDIEYSDDSDEENEMIEKIGEIPYSERLCQVCSRIEPIGTEFPFKSEIRTWPFDEYRHKKWLEIMDWPQEFEESMKTLWQKRRNEGNLMDAYHFCPINVCQSHLDFRNLPERMDDWLKSFCVLCDTCMTDKNLLVPFPISLKERREWITRLFPLEKPSNFSQKKINWLRRRLLRKKPTKYRLCVYHFSRDEFLVKIDNTFILDPEAYPLPMDGNDFDMTPRGPTSLSKCLLCDDWKKQTDMVILRNPVFESDKLFLCECLVHAEKSVIRRTVNALSKIEKPMYICSQHFPDGMDPFSIIAERRILYGTVAECVLCSHVEDCTAMIPFPYVNDSKTRRKWINAMCREPWIYRFITKRLDKEGRHYLCASHFSRSSLRFQPGLGLWRKNGTTPLLACTNEEERQDVWDLSKIDPEYHPLLLESIDSDGIGPIDYDMMSELLGWDRMAEIESELLAIGSSDFRTRFAGDRLARMAKQAEEDEDLNEGTSPVFRHEDSEKDINEENSF